jgi:DNA-directed RNA polymerase subunit RPC12/RpoP
MSYVIIIAAAALVLTGAFFLYPRKAKTRAPEAAGAVSCKRCGARIFVSNPSKLQSEFSVKCAACDTRKLYKLVDLTG